MKNYRVILRFDISAENEVEAAKEVNRWLNGTTFAFEVVEDAPNAQTHLVDFEADGEPEVSVLENEEWVPKK